VSDKAQAIGPPGFVRSRLGSISELFAAQQKAAGGNSTGRFQFLLLIPDYF
jgi:hypothetical protein